MRKHTLFSLFIILSVFTFAQDSNRSGTSSFRLQFSGAPVATFSTVDTSYQNALSISPVLDLRTKHGWGITYSPSIVTSGQRTGIYMHSLSAGYEQYGRKKYDLAFNFTHNFFTNKTSVPYSSLANEIFFVYAYSKTWLKPVFFTSIGFGKDSDNVSTHDIGLAAGLSHDIKWEDEGIFSSIDITPAVLLDAGTNGYFSFLRASKYLSHSHRFVKYIKKHGKGVITKSPLALSNLELNLETDFVIGSFSIHPSGSIFFPLGRGTDHNAFGYGEISLQYSF
jgi:hypothetical protein